MIISLAVYRGGIGFFPVRCTVRYMSLLLRQSGPHLGGRYSRISRITIRLISLLISMLLAQFLHRRLYIVCDWVEHHLNVPVDHTRLSCTGSVIEAVVHHCTVAVVLFRLGCVDIGFCHKRRGTRLMTKGRGSRGHVWIWGAGSIRRASVAIPRTVAILVTELKVILSRLFRRSFIRRRRLDVRCLQRMLPRRYRSSYMHFRLRRRVRGRHHIQILLRFLRCIVASHSEVCGRRQRGVSSLCLRMKTRILRK